jgi:ribosomal protein S6--L-glutamate ligase
MQRDDKVTSVVCEAPLSDQRWVTNSSGVREHRYIIATELQIGPRSWSIELSLTNREAMGFSMIIGREAMRNRLIVDPRASYRAGRNLTKVIHGSFDELDGPETGGVIK